MSAAQRLRRTPDAELERLVLILGRRVLRDRATLSDRLALRAIQREQRRRSR